MTSLFSRLQKLNKEATPGRWKWAGRGVTNEGDTDLALVPESNTEPWYWDGEIVLRSGCYDENSVLVADADAALIVECRNSLPAVLNLIEAAQRFCEDDDIQRLLDHWAFPADEFKALCEAVAVFVSGQED